MGVWQSFDATHGLWGGVRALRQDRKGYLWIGTRNAGLFRFDGSSFRRFTMQDGLPHNCIENILEDEQGRLWLATSNGLSCFDGKAFVNYGVEQGLPHPFLWWLCHDHQGRLWCTTRAGVACQMEPGHFRVFTETDGLGASRVGSVACDPHGVLWFGTFGGLTSYDGKRFINRTTEDGLIDNDVGTIAIDQKGRVWCGTHKGISCFDGKQFTNYDTRDGMGGTYVMTLYVDQADRIWCGHLEYGVSCWDGSHFETYETRDGLAGNQVRAILQDSEGILYFGMLDAGITRFDPRSINLLSAIPVNGGLHQTMNNEVRYAYRASVCQVTDSSVLVRSFSDNVRMMVEDKKGRTSVHTCKGCYRFHSNESLMNPDSTGEDPVLESGAYFDGYFWDLPLSPLATQDGFLWYGSMVSDIVYRFDHGILERISTGLEQARPLLEDRQGGLWIGDSNQRRLVCYRKGVLSPVFQDGESGLPGDTEGFRCAVETRDGLIWLGTTRGLTLYAPELNIFFNLGEIYADLNCSCITVDNANVVWVGTFGGGIYRFKGKVSQQLTLEDGLPSNTIVGFLPQSDGTMLIGTLGGLVRYTPTATTPPCVEIIELIADKAYWEPETVELVHEAARHVTINFRAMAFSTRHMSYAYRLEPLDPTWRYTRNDSVRYENLSLGIYTFQVMAYNRDLVPSAIPATITVRVLPSPAERRIKEYARQLDEMVHELELQTRIREQNHALVELARQDPFKEDNTQVALQECANVAIRVLRIARVSIWLDNSARTGLQCVFCRDIRSDLFDTPSPIDLDHTPVFYSALATLRILSIVDTMLDDRVTELSNTYLKPNDIRALLGAPLRMGGKTIGLLLCEQINQPREFTFEEQYFITSLADLFSLMWNNAERRRAEKALRESEDRFRGTFEQAAVGIGHFDKDGILLRVNQKFCEILGYSADELMGINGDELTPLEDRNREYLFIQKAFNDAQQTCSLEKRFICKDQSTVWVNLTVSYVKDNKGQAKYYICVIEDITTRRELEAELRQAQKMEAVGLLAGGVAHDFNNILHAIQGYIGLALLDMNEGEKPYRYLKEAEMAGERATTLVRQLLTLSRKKALQRNVVDLNVLITNLVRMLSRILGEHIEVHTEFAADLDRVYADASQVEQVLMNLCINARDAMLDGGTLRIGVYNTSPEDPAFVSHARARSGSFVCLSVTDTGAGISPDVQDHIFEPFFTTKEGGRGTGMGLAIVYGIVDQHGGFIEVQSRPGDGTEFKVYLPVAESVIRESPPPAATSIKGGNETILLAEDDELVRTLNEQVLQTAGYKLIVARDGEEAIAAFDHYRDTIEMALLDVVMPKKNGRIVFEHMKRYKPDLRVLFSSGYSFDTLGGALSGLDHDLLHKPYTPHDLLNRVREVLDR